MTTPVNGVQAFSPVILYGPNGQKITVTSQQQETSLQTQGYTTSPSGPLTTNQPGTQSTDSTTKKHGHHSFSVTMTKTDPKTGQTSSVTASSKAQIEAYEAQGYAAPDKAGGGAKPAMATTSSGTGTLTTTIPSGNALKD